MRKYVNILLIINMEVVMIYLKEKIFTKLKELKQVYEKDGFIILGLFGSYARDEADHSSDIDILYKLDTDKFLSKYSGFKAVNRLLEIKNEIADAFNKDVDIADISTLSKTGKKYILDEVVYA